jgi:CO/xanthine dehydrogenase FAD-binding subunit
MQEFNFTSPTSLGELLEVLDETQGSIIAGGTDVIPKMRHNLFFASTLIDASRIHELRFIEEQDDAIVVGALITHEEMSNSALLHSANPALSVAAASVGCVQTRQRGTLGGNVANASPAADAVPALMVFNAQVRLLGKGTERTLPLIEFFRGPGETIMAKSEFIHSLSFKRLTGAWGADFQKLGKRNGMTIAVVNAAAVVGLDEAGRISDARLAFGSVAPSVVRSPKAEALLIGQRPTQEVIKAAAQASVGDIAPISDVRSTAEYRENAAVILAGRVVERAVAQARSRLS